MTTHKHDYCKFCGETTWFTLQRRLYCKRCDTLLRKDWEEAQTLFLSYGARLETWRAPGGDILQVVTEP